MGKKVLIFVTALALIVVLGAVTAFAAGTYPIFLDGVMTELAGFTKDGVTTVGLRQLSEALGFKVNFKDDKIFIESPSVSTKDSLKVTTLAENNNNNHPDLTKEFGFVVLIENGDDKLIFDTAKAGEFVNNAKKLGIDLSQVNKMVLSHAHYDHCGGVLEYYNTYGTDGKILYVKDSFFDLADNKYAYDPVGVKLDFTDGTPGYFPVGINFSAEDLKAKNVAIEYIDTDEMRIGDNITIFGNFKADEEDLKAQNMLVKNSDNEYEVDDFDEEVAVVIDTEQGLVILTGCSHTGILNIVNTIQERTGQKVYAVIGGFHLLSATEEVIQETIDRFKELDVEKIGLSHCTGPTATKMFMEQMPDKTFINDTGTVFEVK